jgi:hypothetical protein
MSTMFKCPSLVRNLLALRPSSMTTFLVSSALPMQRSDLCVPLKHHIVVVEFLGVGKKKQSKVYNLLPTLNQQSRLGKPVKAIII